MTFDQLALKAPKGRNTVLLQGKSSVGFDVGDRSCVDFLLIVFR